jgi:FkbM family methyltransferase
MAGCEPELAQLHRIGPNRGFAIDAGANLGLFSYRLTTLYERVHAFEINPALAGRLSQWKSNRLEVHAIGLSSREGSGALYTPIYRGRRLDGWASLEQGNCPAADRYEETRAFVRPLDSFELSGITFMKADVEGHEKELLVGGQDTIRRNRPVVLMEVKDSNLPFVRDFFNRLGYCERRLDELLGVSGSTENYIYMPEPAAACASSTDLTP